MNLDCGRCGLPAPVTPVGIVCRCQRVEQPHRDVLLRREAHALKREFEAFLAARAGRQP